jgi:hypothetical protein
MATQLGEIMRSTRAVRFRRAVAASCALVLGTAGLVAIQVAQAPQAAALTYDATVLADTPQHYWRMACPTPHDPSSSIPDEAGSSQAYGCGGFGIRPSAVHDADASVPTVLGSLPIGPVPLRRLLEATEAGGLGGDVAIDWIKGHTVNHETICDEGLRGFINPFHRWLPGPLKGPVVYLPGIHANGEVDFEW